MVLSTEPAARPAPSSVAQWLSQAWAAAGRPSRVGSRTQARLAPGQNARGRRRARPRWRPASPGALRLMWRGDGGNSWPGCSWARAKGPTRTAPPLPLWGTSMSAPCSTRTNGRAESRQLLQLRGSRPAASARGPAAVAREGHRLRGWREEPRVQLARPRSGDTRLPAPAGTSDSLWGRRLPAHSSCSGDSAGSSCCPEPGQGSGLARGREGAPWALWFEQV